MKKLLPFIFLLIPLTLKAESASVGGNFRGLNNGDSSILIADNEAQDLLNVDLTKNAYGVSKRAGYDDFKTIGNSTWGVRGGYYFTDQSGNNKIIHTNGTGVFYSLNGGAYTGFYTTATAGSYWDFVDSQGILYGANHNHDPPFTYNGTALTFSTSVPAGSQVEAYPDRLVVAGSTANPNNIYFSRAANFSDFTVGSLSDDAPYFEYYGLPGQLVQAIKYALGELLIWTKTSMGRYVGSNQFDGTIDDISSTIGSDQPSTIVTDLGVTYFQATDRHFYAYDGQSIEKISDAISGSVDNFVRGEMKSWVVTTQSDYARGISNSISTSTIDGSVVLSTNSTNLNNNSFETTLSPSWSGTGTTTLSTTFAYDGVQSVQMGNAVDCSASQWKTEFLDSASSVLVTYNNSYGDFTADNWSTKTVRMTDLFPSIKGMNIKIRLTAEGGNTLTSEPFLYGGSTMTYQLYKWNTGGGCIMHLDYVQGGKTTITSGTYTTESIPLGPITSFGQFYPDSQSNNGTISYGFYTDSDTVHSVSDLSSFISSQTIISGAVPSMSTASYCFLTTAIEITTTSALSQQPRNDSLTVTWFDGVLTRAWGNVDKDHRILWSVAEGTATAPNSTYIYDPRFQSWLKYSAPFDAPARVGDSIYFGGVSTGVVYQWPSGNTDNGSAINAYWKSKDFIAPDPYVEKDFLSASVVAKTQTGSNLDVIYTINTSSSITKNFSLTDSNGLSLKRINFSLPSGKYGTFINFRFGNDDSDAPFEFYSFKYDYKPRPWRQIQ